MTQPLLSSLVALLVSLSGPFLLGQQPSMDRNSLGSRLDRAPLVFEPNRGQAGPDVRYLSRAGACTALLSSDKTVLVLPPMRDAGDGPAGASVVTLELLSSNKEARPDGLELLPGKSNYFIGKQSTNWITGIPQYGRVRFHSIYPGTDLIYYGNGGQLEYDFVLSPGADSHTIRFRVTGAKKVELDGTGSLLLAVPAGSIRLQKPAIYQESTGGKKLVAGDFVLDGPNEVAFRVGDYDHQESLVIDPALSYATLIGANNNTQVQGVAVDAGGNVYVTGTTFATNYPTMHPFQPTNKGTTNVFVTKLNPSGNVILYSTYIGSGGFDNAAAIAVDGSDSAYITGTVGASNFPTTSGAFMTTCPSLCNTPFVSKFLSDGTLAFSTFMGGSNSPAHAIAVSSEGEAYIAGNTASGDLPTTPGSFEPTYPGLECTSCYNGYVEKLNASGTALVYSTYFGIAGFADVPTTLGTGIAVNRAGNAYLVGNSSGIPLKNPIQSSNIGNAFIAEFSPDGATLVFSTYFGGGGENATGIAVDSFGNVHIVGTSSSCEFPLSLNAFSTDCVTQEYTQKVFVTTLNPSGNHILFSTFLQNGFSSGIAVDSAGNSYVTGTDTSNAVPILNAIDNSSQSSATAFVTELDLSGKLLFSSYLGGITAGSSATGIAVDSKGGIYVVGAGQGDFPLLHPIPSQVFQSTYDTFFIAKVVPGKTPQFSLSPRVSPVLALRNVSSVPLTISAITPSANFTKEGDCGASLAPGAACTLILEGAADHKTTGTVTITSNAYSNPQQFTIQKSPNGDSVGANLTIFPLSLNFPAQLIGTTSAVRHIVMRNVGLQPAAINSIEMIQPSAFTETNNCPALLHPFTSCTITVKYAPATVQDSAQLAIVADPSQTRYTAFLSGFGGSSAILASTPSVEFGNQFVGAAPLGRIVNFTNTTPYPASITALSTTAGFAQTNTCTVPLPPQGSCRVALTFVPSANQDSTGNLVASTLGPGGPQTVNLHGTGLIVSDLTISPMPLNLYAIVNNASGSGVITLANSSRSPVNLLGFEISGPFSQTNNCPRSLAVAESCNLTVTFKPAHSGVFNGNISIKNSGPNSPQVAPIIGSAQTVLTVTPTAVDFGQQKLRAKSPGYFGIGNGTGLPTVTVSSVRVQGADFSLPPSPCPKAYPPFYGCEFEVDFAPSEIGVRTGTVTIVASDSTSPHVVSLQGIGVSNGEGTLSATSVDFGVQTVGTRSSSHDVTLTNTGTGVLNLIGISASQQFTQTNTCKASLATKASCTISIQFAPTLPGILEGTLLIQDDGLGSPHTVVLTGIGH